MGSDNDSHAAAGDGAERSPSFDAVYARYARTVHGIALASVGPDDAEDVMQEVFVKVHDRLHTVRDEQAFGAWIASVTRNAATDLARSRQRRARIHEPLADREPIAPGPRRGDGLAHRVLELIRSLPEAFRETLTMRLCEGLTGPEIAARTGRSPGAIRVNLHRGMEQLRPLLEREGWGGEVTR